MAQLGRQDVAGAGSQESGAWLQTGYRADGLRTRQVSPMLRAQLREGRDAWALCPNTGQGGDTRGLQATKAGSPDAWVLCPRPHGAGTPGCLSSHCSLAEVIPPPPLPAGRWGPRTHNNPPAPTIPPPRPAPGRLDQETFQLCTCLRFLELLPANAPKSCPPQGLVELVRARSWVPRPPLLQPGLHLSRAPQNGGAAGP